MKQLLVVCRTAFLLLLVSATSFAENSELGTFSMYQNVGGPNGECSHGIKLTLDRGEMTGRFAMLSDFVTGICAIKVAPNERMYRLELILTDRCNHRYYAGTRATADGEETITIIDGRNTACETSIHKPKAPIEMRIGGFYDDEALSFYSYASPTMPLR